MQRTSFLGTGWGFPPTFDDAKRGVRMVSDEEDIAESLRILFNTRLGERVLRPDYGAALIDQVFEPMGHAIPTYLEDIIRTAIVYHEPRIKLDLVRVTPEPLEGRLLITLDYTIRSTNSRFNMVYPFYVTEASSTV